VDVAKSVSRVGGKAQRAAYRAVAGDLKLAYAQFEELETFSRFGARLDDDTRRIIEHGRRIRACLKQPEFAPVAVPAQIAVLLALTANLFDPVPLDQMKEAGHAVQEAAARIPVDVSARFDTADNLSGEDRKAIIEIARQALVAYLPKPEAKPNAPDQKSDKKPEPEAKIANKSESKANQPTPGSESKPAHKEDPKPETESKADSKSGSDALTEAKPDAQLKPRTESESKPDGSTRSKSGTEPEAKAKP